MEVTSAAEMGRMKGCQERSFEGERTWLRKWVERMDFQDVGTVSKENRMIGITMWAVTFQRAGDAVTAQS